VQFYNYYHKRRGTPLDGAVYCGRFKMQSTKQQGILHIFNKANESF